MDAQVKAEIARAVRVELVALISGKPRSEVGMQADSYLDSFLTGVKGYLLNGSMPAGGKTVAPTDSKVSVVDLKAGRADLYDKGLHPGGRTGMFKESGSLPGWDPRK